jgi:UDP-glucose 4-epimerase
VSLTARQPGLNVLVTGGAGFIGSHLCDAVVGRGWRVWCVDNLRLGRLRNIAHLEEHDRFAFRNLDLLDRDAVRGLFDEIPFDAVFHLAANSDTRAGNADTWLDMSLNCGTTLELLDVMRAAPRPARLVFASTSAV